MYYSFLNDFGKIGVGYNFTYFSTAFVLKTGPHFINFTVVIAFLIPKSLAVCNLNSFHLSRRVLNTDVVKGDNECGEAPSERPPLWRIFQEGCRSRFCSFCRGGRAGLGDRIAKGRSTPLPTKWRSPLVSGLRVSRAGLYMEIKI